MSALLDGPAPEGFLVGLAAIAPLSQAAEERPLVCLVDRASPAGTRRGANP
ncbi:MAG TPA: hypothetical protein VGI55_17830 [Solirubrobacteraceae bacterium]